MQLAWKFGIVAAVALVLVALPGGGERARRAAHGAHDHLLRGDCAAGGAPLSASTGSTSSRSSRTSRLALYGSLAIALLTFTGTDRLFNSGGAGVLVWFALLALASYGLFWAWTRYRRYE